MDVVNGFYEWPVIRLGLHPIYPICSSSYFTIQDTAIHYMMMISLQIFKAISTL